MPLVLLQPQAALAQQVVVVRAGETLSEIADRHGVSLTRLMQANGLSNPDHVEVGQRLTLPGSASRASSGSSQRGGSVTVRAGETLSEIADRHGVSLTRLMQANGLSNPDHVEVGQRLTLPGGAAARGNQPTAPYTVKSGETLSDIATRFKTTTDRLIQLNGLRDPDLVISGTRLQVPAPARAAAPAKPAAAPVNRQAREHVVTRGESLSLIAERYGTSVDRLVALNQLEDPERLLVGTRLKLRGTPPAAQPSRRPAAAAPVAAAQAAPAPVAAAPRPTQPTTTPQPKPQPTATQPASTADPAATQPAARPAAAPSAATAAPAATPRPTVATSSSTSTGTRDTAATASVSTAPVSTGSTATTRANPAAPATRSTPRATTSSASTTSPVTGPSSAPAQSRIGQATTAASQSPSRLTSATATTAATTTAAAVPAAARTAATASPAATSPTAARKPASGDWRNYGPLQVDWSKLQPMGGSYVAPSLNGEGQPLYLAVNCTARKINVTSQAGQWKTWETPSKDFEQKLVQDICRARGS